MLESAVYSSHLEAAQLYLEYGADIINADPEYVGEGVIGEETINLLNQWR